MTTGLLHIETLHVACIGMLRMSNDCNDSNSEWAQDFMTLCICSVCGYVSSTARCWDLRYHIDLYHLRMVL